MRKFEFDVRTWLRSFDMENYSSNFINNGFKSLMVCSNLTEDDLRAIGITLRGHIKDILLHSQDLKNSNNLLPACFSSHYNKILPKLSIIESSQSLPALVQTEHSPRDLKGGRRQLTDSYHIRAKWVEPRQHSNFEYLLVRHGESEANVNNTLYSTVADHAVKLSKKGEEQARDAGKQN